MKIAKICLLLLTVVMLQSCVRTKVVDVKSPCVSGEDGPCSVRKPINTWLDKQQA